MTDSLKDLEMARLMSELSSRTFQRDEALARFEAMAETVRALEAERDRLQSEVLTWKSEAGAYWSALSKIATGEGIYGMQALEYKNIARAALNPSTGVGEAG